MKIIFLFCLLLVTVVPPSHAHDSGPVLPYGHLYMVPPFGTPYVRPFDSPPLFSEERLHSFLERAERLKRDIERDKHEGDLLLQSLRERAERDENDWFVVPDWNDDY